VVGVHEIPELHMPELVVAVPGGPLHRGIGTLPR
jgi:hypothetical protein